MPIVYFQEASEAFVLATSMQTIAVDPGLWAAYMRCNSAGRDVFKKCASDPYLEWGIDTVIAWADFVDNPPPVALPAPPPPAPVVQAPPHTATAPTPSIRARGTNEDKSAKEFYQWMVDHTKLVGADTGIGYLCGNKRELASNSSEVTIAVSVGFTRGAKPVGGKGLGFVFHYHPGVKGASVGHGAASKWHFKPYDGAPKFVRLTDSNFNLLNAAMVKRVKDIACGK